MAISFPAAEAAAGRLERKAEERSAGASLILRTAHLLRRAYERLDRAIFESDGDCMRL